MPEALVVTDTSALIAFDKVDRLDLLPALFDDVVAPPAVVREFGARPPWLREVPVQDAALVAEHRAHFLDEGEAEAIALARTLPGATLLLDERRGRRYAQALGLTVVGRAGVLVRAKRAGHIVAVRPLLDTLRDRGFRLSDRLYDRVLVLADERAP